MVAPARQPTDSYSPIIDGHAKLKGSARRGVACDERACALCRSFSDVLRACFRYGELVSFQQQRFLHTSGLERQQSAPTKGWPRRVSVAVSESQRSLHRPCAKGPRPTNSSLRLIDAQGSHAALPTPSVRDCKQTVNRRLRALAAGGARASASASAREIRNPSGQVTAVPRS